MKIYMRGFGVCVFKYTHTHTHIYFIYTHTHTYVCLHMTSLVAQMVKNLPAMRETLVQSLGQEDSPEKGKATHSSILAWRISWAEEPGGLQSMGSQRVGHNWATDTFTFMFIHIHMYICIHFKKWKSTKYTYELTQIRGLITSVLWEMNPEDLVSGQGQGWCFQTVTLTQNCILVSNLEILHPCRKNTQRTTTPLSIFPCKYDQGWRSHPQSSWQSILHLQSEIF